MVRGQSKSCYTDGEGNPVPCGRPQKAKERCPTHYQQWHRLQPKCKAPDCRRMQAAHYYCRPHEQLALTSRPTLAQQRTLTNFRRFIEPDLVSGCWLWMGATNEKGYGMFSADGTWLAHRFSYVWFLGGHDQGKVLDHICNVTRCVRPDHLWAITNTNNLSLMHQRALAEDKEFWRHTAATPLYLSVFLWAVGNDLPCRKARPRPLDTLAAA